MVFGMTTVGRIASEGHWRVIAHNPETHNQWLLDECKTQIAAYARVQDEARDDTSIEFMIFNDVGKIIGGIFLNGGSLDEWRKNNE